MDADSVQVNVVIRAEIDIGGRVQSSDERMSLKLINQGGSVQAELTAPGEVYGMSGTMTMYIKDNQIYINYDGLKIRRTLTKAEQNSMFSTSQPAKYPASVVKEQETEVSGGKTTLRMTVSGDAIIDYYKKSTGNDLAAGKVEIRDAVITAVVGRSGCLETFSMKYTVIDSSGEQTAVRDVNISAEYIQVGNTTIDFPEDLDTYESF